jgi:PHD/YefM family antitoxin component YafN of YafNO toxin-antitoxin module
MALLDEHYPADVFGGDSGDLGPRVVALIREIDSLRETVEILSDPETMTAIREGQAASAAGDTVSIEELIERSSLGTPEARRMRERISPERAQRIVARAAELEQQQSGDANPGETT